MTKAELQGVLDAVRSVFPRRMGEYAYDVYGLMDCVESAMECTLRDIEDYARVSEVVYEQRVNVAEVDRLVNFVKYDRVHQIDVLGGRKAYKEQVQRFRERGEAMTEGFWTKCWEVARDGEQEADADAARLGEDAGGEVSGTQRAQHRVEG